MAVTITCPSCKKSHDLADTQVGREMRCDACGKVFKASRGTPLWVKLAAGLCGLILVVAIVWVAVLMLGNKVTAENYQKLHEGMTESEVQAILGAPRHKRPMKSGIPGREETDYWIWMDGSNNTITVVFVEGKAVELMSNLQAATPK
jgi:hypothetical protein